MDEQIKKLTRFMGKKDTSRTVNERIFWDAWNPYRNFSDTFMLLNRIEKKYPELEWEIGYTRGKNHPHFHEGYHCSIFPIENSDTVWISEFASTVPLAICDAILQLIEQEK